MLPAIHTLSRNRLGMRNFKTEIMFLDLSRVMKPAGNTGDRVRR